MDPRSVIRGVMDRRRESFGGGMLPFDVAYSATILRRSPALAQAAGVNAVCDEVERELLTALPGRWSLFLTAELEEISYNLAFGTLVSPDVNHLLYREIQAELALRRVAGARGDTCDPP